MTVTRKWSLMAALLVVAIFLASWFLLISPRRSEAASLRSQTTEQDAANARLQEKIAQLQSQAQDLPKQQARLAAIKVQIPENPALPALIRDLSAAAKKSGVSLDSLAPSKPVALVTAAAPVPAATTGTGSSSGTTTSTQPSAPAAPAPANLFQVPVIVAATGSYFEIEQFVNKVEDLKRAFLVTGLTIGQAQSSGTASAPTTGELTATINGRVFLSPPASSATAPIVPTPAPAAK